MNTVRSPVSELKPKLVSKLDIIATSPTVVASNSSSYMIRGLQKAFILLTLKGVSVSTYASLLLLIEKAY